MDMPLVQVSVPAGSLTAEQKRELIAKVTDVVVEVEGIPAVRPSVWVQISEIPDGGWGMGGHAFDLAAITELLGVGNPNAH
jgi:4-oxalocrotonate tautomerase